MEDLNCRLHRVESLVIALDVDGVLAPWLEPDYGRMLLTLAAETNAELVWATGRNHQANQSIGPAIGLPPLAVVDLTGVEPNRAGVHWKVPHIAAWVGRRPLAWLDDEFQDSDFDWAATRTATGLPTLLVPVDERDGFESAHATTVRTWAAGR